MSKNPNESITGLIYASVKVMNLKVELNFEPNPAVCNCWSTVSHCVPSAGNVTWNTIDRIDFVGLSVL